MREALVVLGAAAIVIPLLHRLRLSPVVGYMLVGLLAGPSGLGALAHWWTPLGLITIADRARIEPVAELGVVLLMFAIGLEMSWQRIVSLRRLVFGLGAGQVLLCTGALAALAAAFGVATGPAVIGGLALAMSSTATVTQVLADERRIASLAGRASFAVLLFQDLAVVPILFLLGMLGGGRGGLAGLLGAIGEAVAAIVALALIGRLGLRPLFRSVARTDSPELFMAACLLVVLATGLAAASAGLSMALGALIAGVLLAETEYRRQIEVTVEPFKGLLLGVFLISVGLRLDLARLAEAPGLVLGGVLAVVGVKAAITFGLARAFRVRGGAALQAALLLGPGGEFGFVIIGLAASFGLLPAGLDRSLFLITALSMAAIPSLSWAGRRLAPRPRPTASPDLLPPSDPAGGGVIIAGFGRVGRVVAAMLDAHAIPWVALDSDIGRVSEGRKARASVFYGDMTQPALLNSVGLHTARALVVTIDDRSRADTIVQIARAARPDLLIVVRARDATHAAQLYGAGATDAVPETIEASLQLSEAVLVDLGIPMGPVLVSVHEQRARFQAEIRRMAPGATIRPRARRRLGEAAPAAPPVD
ncbi:MAG: cation:proton antiporter [Acetobacteraceae bacterium]|nr:cation:proton antiporter [Acetobacteraceae bacterium]